uniref:Tyrosine-protein phosphatase domain-containing protein n=1 Tax=Parascaris univalens TaxID=6257 RepID=A0A915BAA2_PARUN
VWFVGVMAAEDEEGGQQAQQDVSAPEEALEDSKMDTLTPKEFVDMIAREGEQLLVKWHKMITKNPPKVDAFLEPSNASKNRFPNILLYDRSRVKINDNLGEDYYHASFVDSYDKIDGYILAQAPFDDSTESDFWRLVYQERPRLIVLLSALTGADDKKLLRNFWPNEAKLERRFVNGYIVVRCNSVDQVKLESARAIKEFRNGPICLVCPSGVHRCGTFAVLDIILERLANERKVGLLETVAIVRKQRYGCVTHFTHYNHVANMIVRQAISSGIVDHSCIGGSKKK